MDCSSGYQNKNETTTNEQGDVDIAMNEFNPNEVGKHNDKPIHNVPDGIDHEPQQEPKPNDHKMKFILGQKLRRQIRPPLC